MDKPLAAQLLESIRESALKFGCMDKINKESLEAMFAIKLSSGLTLGETFGLPKAEHGKDVD